MQAGGIVRVSHHLAIKNKRQLMAEFLTAAEKACYIEMEIRAGRARRPIDMTAVLNVLTKATAVIVTLYIAGFILWVLLGVACMEDGHTAEECSATYMNQAAVVIYAPVLEHLEKGV